MKIQGIRLSTPDQSGYPDSVRLLNSDTGDMLVWESKRYRSNPNPTKPNTTLRWMACYAQIAPGVYPWVCKETPKHGKCIALNDEGKIPTTNPDVNNGNQFFATAVLIHCGFSPTWSGSAACQTVHPDDWPDFISHFTLGQTGIYELIDQVQTL
jgi:hypothetical protein